MTRASGSSATLPSAAVLDTSALLGLAHDSELRAAFTSDRISLFVVDLSIYEVIDVLSRELQRPPSAIATDVENVFDLDVPIVALDRGLAAEAAWLSAHHRITAAEAAMLAAARRLGIPLLTLDRDFPDRAPGEQVVVLGAALA